MPHPAEVIAHRIRLGGRVQGVGFRPFVWRLAHREGLTGWVRNLSGQVEIFVQGTEPALSRFSTALLREAPALARPELLLDMPEATAAPDGFTVLDSDATAAPDIHLPPDQFTCDGCLRELADPADRRYRYPFINCTQCGPRYTLIERLPYDRRNTTMAAFPLCTACAAEYANPANRRFHAEPVACPDCGPRIAFIQCHPAGSDGATTARSPAAVVVATGEAALRAALESLREGAVLAIKGIGGYHLVCDARNAAAIARLRQRKPRPHKPLAVMLPDIATARRLTGATEAELALLESPIRPIVLVRGQPAADLPEALAPNLDELGIMLPYSPLHHLLAREHAGPLVVTSANPSGEPVLIDGGAVEARLGHVVNGFLHHDQPIVRHADDPVYRVIAGRARPIRLGRGNAPLEIELSFALPRSMLALGGHMKTTIALGWDRRVVVSPHLGDMDTPRGLALLRKTAADLQALYQTSAELVCHDAHPGYATTRLARSLSLPIRAVFHHEAHASALAAEHPQPGDWIVFAWDGNGYGRDGTIWGGEALVGAPGHWRRGASFRPFRLPGGDKAARQPWRSALTLAWETGHHWTPGEVPEADDADRSPPPADDIALLRQAWRRGVNSPTCTSAGRLFDAAATFLGLVSRATFEGQAPMYLEAAAAGATGSIPRRAHTPDPIPLPLTRDGAGLWRTDWAPLLPALLDPRRTVAHRAALFHASLAEALLAQARTLREGTGITRLGLTGGVFQNRLLTETIVHRAAELGFTVHLPERVPCNDAGLSFGQIIEAAACP